jgi:hypothetical protein
MAADVPQKVFRQVLQNAKDVTNTFDIDLGSIPEDVVASHQQAEPYIQQVRTSMEQSQLAPDVDLSTVSVGLINMQAWVEIQGVVYVPCCATSHIYSQAL